MPPGLYDGFEGFKSATTNQQREAVRDWLVVLDTNVLLSMYNFHGQSLEDFRRVFAALGDRLFIPHQVLDEFWRNRRTVLSENRGKHREREVVEKAFDDIDAALRRWNQRVVDRAGRPPALVLKELKEGREAVLGYMDKKNDEADIANADTPTHADRVLSMLEGLLRDRVGAAPSAEERGRLLKEGERRIAAKIPPGYLDAGKNPERASGDFLVWNQTIARSRETDMSVLLITQDQKEDWWADRGTSVMRARPEMVAELRAEAGHELLMMRPHDLLGYADVLGVEVSRASVVEAEEASEAADADETKTLTGVGILYDQFWRIVEPRVKELGWTRSNRPSRHWWSMPAGGGGNTYALSYAKFGCRVELYFSHRDREVNLYRLRLLQAKAAELQTAFGNDEVIIFDELPEGVACRVDIRLEDGRQIADEELWQETADWMIDRSQRLRAAVESVGGVPLALPDDGTPSGGGSD